MEYNLLSSFYISFWIELRSAPPFMFRAEMWEYSPKTIKIRIFPTNLPLRDYSFAQFFYEIVSVCRRL